MMAKTESQKPLFRMPKCFCSFEAKFAKPGRCGDRIVTIVVQVKDTYGATAICGGASHPEGVYACPTAVVDPFAGSTADLLADLEEATKSVERKANFVSSSDMLTKTMAVKTARGGNCLVRNLVGAPQRICPA